MALNGTVEPLALKPALRTLLIGDWGGQPQDRPTQKRLASQMGRTASQFPGFCPVIALGDNFYKRGVESVDDEQFKQAFEEVYDAASLQHRWYVVAGNRDHKGNIGAQLAYTHFSHRWYFPSLYYTETLTVPGMPVTVQFIFFDTMTYLGKKPTRTRPVAGDNAGNFPRGLDICGGTSSGVVCRTAWTY
jgi:tartrate-resistant acid phosphatase type 5